MFEMTKANLYKRRHVLMALFSSSLFTYKTWANASAPEMLDAGNLPEHVVVAVTLFCEARNQGYRGIRLVLDVIHNRKALEGGDTTLKDVCLRNYQFSCWNAEGSAHKLLERQDNRELPFPDSLMWSYCWVLACDKSYTPLNPYTHYYHKDLRVQDRPSWTWEMWHEYRYRDHIFLVMQK